MITHQSFDASQFLAQMFDIGVYELLAVRVRGDVPCQKLGDRTLGLDIFLEEVPITRSQAQSKPILSASDTVTCFLDEGIQIVLRITIC